MSFPDLLAENDAANLCSQHTVRHVRCTEAGRVAAAVTCELHLSPCQVIYQPGLVLLENLHSRAPHTHV